MSETPPFDEVRFKAATAVFRLGNAEFTKRIRLRKRKLPKGLIPSPDDPARMIDPVRLRHAVGYYDICLELWPLAEDDMNACMAMNMKARTLRALGDFQAAAAAYAKILTVAKKAGDKPYAEVSEMGINYCNERLKKT